MGADLYGVLQIIGSGGKMGVLSDICKSHLLEMSVEPQKI